MHVVFHSNFAAYIVCLRYKPCEFPGIVWTGCWGNKSYYVITSPANCLEFFAPSSTHEKKQKQKTTKKQMQMNDGPSLAQEVN